MGSCASKTAVENSSDIADQTKQTLISVGSPGFKYETGTCALEYFDPIKELEEGSISSIHLVRRRKQRIDVPYREKGSVMKFASDDPINENESVYALKSIIKEYVRNDKFLQEMRSEIYTMSNLEHPNIAKVYEAYERKRHIYLIMEYCAGDNLVDLECDESQAAVITAKVLSAVAYMHEHNVVHRDIKLENIMFDKPRPEGEIKIIDFGLATRYLTDDHRQMTEQVGTVYTMAPQVLQGVYDSKRDLWSIGVVAYILLSGLQPFWGPQRKLPWEERKEIMIDRIMRGEYMRMSGGKWDKVSADAKAFVQSLLQIDPELRPSAKEVFAHSWIKQHYDDKVTFDGEKVVHDASKGDSVEFPEDARVPNILATPLNTVVPGGRAPLGESARFVYDSASKSIRKSSRSSG